MLKAQIRSAALERRKALTDEECAELSNNLLETFKTLDFSKISSIHIFLPIVAKKEPDTFLFIDWLSSAYPAMEILVPIADFESRIMTHYHYPGKKNLIISSYGIPEPHEAEVAKANPDMVLLPLLGFDNRGYRVGYGKGFYDQFLQQLDTQKIGLSFFEATTEIIDVHLNDVRMDMCITPTGLIKF